MFCRVGVRAEQERPQGDDNGTLSEAELLSIRQRAEEMAGDNPQLTEAVMQELAAVEAAARNRGGPDAVGTASEEEHESEQESVTSSFFEQDPEWFYVQLNVLLGLYNQLHDRSSWSLWCVRPPEVYKG